MKKDSWEILKQYTNARIAMGHAGYAIPSEDILKFRMAHSLAKDALSSEIDINKLTAVLNNMDLNSIKVQSVAIDKNEYLRDPAKGKALNAESKTKLESLKSNDPDLCIIIADGLSADAVNFHAAKLIGLLIPKIKDWKLAPMILGKYSRVALSDSIGEILNATISLILIGERPGLSSPHSMGAYLTYKPKTANTDEKRNCVSNIQPGGLSYELASEKLYYLLDQMLTKKISGVQLKDDLSSIYLT